jgi:REP element-mobilizing transposase RayT
MESDKFYHIFNHANGRENLFEEDENYRYFLQQWNKYISPIAETYAYCLMPNHIHFLIRILPEAEVKLNIPTFGKFQTFQKLFSKQFANLFSSYTQAFNKRYHRRGSLFMPNFKRKEVTNERYFKQLVLYIHRNPIHHGFCTNILDWKFNSFHAYLSNNESKINQSLVFEQFEDKANFIACHQHEIEHLDVDLTLE